MGNSTDPVADVRDEWSIATVEVPVPERFLRREATLLVELPCPPPRAQQRPLSDFECEVLETAEHARYRSVTPGSLRQRARRCGWCASAAAVLAAAAIPFPTVIWIGVIPVAVAAGLGWQWAVLGATARRLTRSARDTDLVHRSCRVDRALARDDTHLSVNRVSSRLRTATTSHCTP